ncbi:MAG: hypothetical protein M3443_04165 [Actinomycetota bacterium]|nr:hypothetical protein [Actinomycetota bacterium]
MTTDSRIKTAVARLRTANPLSRYKRDALIVFMLCADRAERDNTLATHVAAGLAHAVDALNGVLPLSNGGAVGGDDQ